MEYDIENIPEFEEILEFLEKLQEEYMSWNSCISLETMATILRR